MFETIQDAIKSYGDIAAAVAAVLAVLALLGRKLLWVWRKIIGFFQEVFLHRALNEKLNHIVAELKHNDGSSIKDAVKRIEAEIRRQAETSSSELEAVKTATTESIDKQTVAILDCVDAMRHETGYMVDRINGKLAALLNQPGAPAMYETNARGECIWASTSYLDKVDRNLEEVLGMGWVNIVQPEHRAAVFQEWADAIAQGRAFEMTIGLQRADGTKFSVLSRAAPIRYAGGGVAGYVGFIQQLVSGQGADIANASILLGTMVAAKDPVKRKRAASKA